MLPAGGKRGKRSRGAGAAKSDQCAAREEPVQAKAHETLFVSESGTYLGSEHDLLQVCPSGLAAGCGLEGPVLALP